MAEQYTLHSVEPEGTANNGLLVEVRRGKERWIGYLEPTDEAEEGNQ